MTEADLAGVRLYYEEAGDGLPFVVLHGGLGYDHCYLKNALGPLEDRMRMIYLDQRGNGRSQRVPLETITVPQLADDVDALRAHLGLERIGVFGHSYGGFVALEYATRYPDRVSHLICATTSPGNFEPTPEELAERIDQSWVSPVEERALALFGDGLGATVDEMWARVPDLVPLFVRSRDVELFRKSLEGTVMEPDASVAGRQALGSWSVADKLGRISAPTLILGARYDLLTPAECSVRLASEIPNNEIVWLSQSAHCPQLDEPDVFFGAIRDWLSRHP
jgi:proline iminopeptidase